MATSSDAQAVKTLNKISGGRRFVFKTFSQRIEEIDIEVYRSIDLLKSEPSEGSSFFRDCLIQWRELNTADDFISFYEEMMPIVQTLPQILLQKELIISKLLSRLKMEGRLSLEPILRLVAALSRDLVEGFLSFIKRIADSLVSLLKSGADREPDIIEQIFTAWSYIMMFLQKYLVKDITYVLKVTVKLRYYPKDYIQEFMAESVSFLLRNGSIEQLIKGVRKIMCEVVKKPMRKSGASALLWYILRGTSSRLHSRANQVLRLLMDCSLFGVGDKDADSVGTVLVVVVATFQRLCEELQPMEGKLMWNCLYEEITDCIAKENSVHLSRLLSLLISTMQNGYVLKISDYQPLLKLVRLLVRTFVAPSCNVNSMETLSDVSDNVLQLMLCILDGLFSANDMSALSNIPLEWARVFELKNSSLLSFIKELLLKDPHVINAFKTNVLSVLNDLIETSTEEVVHLLLIFCERLHVQSSSFLDRTSKKKLSRISGFFQKAITGWIRMINDAVNGNSSCICVEENELALHWGIVSCYPYILDDKENLPLLMDLINALDRFLMINSDDTNLKNTWSSLMGAALSSYHKLHFSCKNGLQESLVNRFLCFAKRYKSTPQVLYAVADILDSAYGPVLQREANRGTYHPDLEEGKLEDAIKIFCENMCHSDKVIRLSTLRVLSHYEPLNMHYDQKYLPVEKKMEAEISQSFHEAGQGCDVLQLLFLIESTPLSIATSRKSILWISQIQMGLSAARISETYLPLVLNGIIGILHNRFSHLWNPALECLAVIIVQYSSIVWERCIQYLEQCQFIFLSFYDQFVGADTEPSNKFSELVDRYNLFVSPPSDRTPHTTVLSLLIQSLQKVSSISESRSRQIIPLFLKFMGYNVDDLVSVNSFKSQTCKGKEWKSVLQEWLNLLRLMRHPKSFYQSHFFKEVLQYRLLDDNDPEIQMKVLDCLLNFKDDFLIPYDLHLKNLISSKTLREELAVWSLSRESGFIDERHRASLVPIVILILTPKVRNLKSLASRKHASVHHRKAVLAFLAQLDVEELFFFFYLLLKPLKATSQGVDANWFWFFPGSSKDEYDLCGDLKHFTVDNILALSWKKRYSFLHVIEDIVGVFDEFHIGPFLDLLMGCVVRILESCTSSLESGRSSGSSALDTDSSFTLNIDEKYSVAKKQTMTTLEMKQFKELRSLCLKIISFVLNKYEDHDFGCEFWELFFTSVKPLIDGFRQEGASSEKPSSLFSCFLAMSRSYKLASLLDKEKNLVPDIFSMLMVTTASEAILSCVFKFIENLLKLDSELDNEGDGIKRILLPNIDVLISSLHWLFTCNNSTKRKLVKYPGERELCVLKLLSKYVKDHSVARKFVDILLPVLEERPQNSDACVETLQVLRHMIRGLGSECATKILKAVCPLLISAGQDVRMSICDVLDALAENDSSLLFVAERLRELNAVSSMDLGAPDYETILAAYEKIQMNFFHAVREEYVLVILSHSIRDISSEEFILRQSANRVLLLFVDFSRHILDHEVNFDHSCWSGACIQHIVNNFLLKHIGDAMNKEASIKKVWMELLREMVLKLPMMPNLNSFKVLCSEDAEQDFFNNIIHLQTHRRARALSRFKSITNSGCLSMVIVNKVFVPLIFNMLLDGKNGKGENVRNACLEALASISGCMEWKQYYALLMRCFREIKLKLDKQRVLLRLICSILDHFHFSDPGKNVLTSSISLRKCSASKLSHIQTCLNKVLLPKIQKMLTSDSDSVNVNSSLVALKLLKLLPGDIMDSQLPNIIHRISNFLKNRLESIRDEARSALAACLKELGLPYLQFVVKVLRAILRRGYEMHVLGFTLSFILSKCLLNPVGGELDYCLEELLPVVENDILGGVAEEKEVEKFASKMKETRKTKSFETLKLIARSITFKTHAVKLLSPVVGHFHEQLNPKVKSKLETMLHYIAAGIECNPTVDRTDLFIFTYGLIKDGIADESSLNSLSSERPTDDSSTEAINSSRLVNVKPRYSHLVTVFSLGVLHNHIKNVKLNDKSEEILSMLDPFVKLLGDCLSSKYEDILSAALRCLSRLVKLPLPSLECQADRMITSLLVIAQGSLNSSSPLMETCLRLLTVLLQITRITLSRDHLHMLIQFPVFVDIERNPSFIALSLLKAIVSRKLVVPEIYDVVTHVAELLVTSQAEPIRKKCSQILLQFLLDYQLSKKRLQQHLDFLLANLRYEHAAGREAVLEMLHAIIIKFPEGVVDEQSQMMFVHLVLCLANDHDKKVRSMTGAVIRLLIGRVNPHSLNSILEYSLSWYSGEKHDLWSASAQVLGLLVEAMKKAFYKYIDRVLPVMRKILQSAISVSNAQLDPSIGNSIPFWKEAYYSLVMFEKILRQHSELCLANSVKDIWDRICEFLLHPHMWLRNISSRLVALYFATVSEVSKENRVWSVREFSLMKPSKLLFLALSLCCQLKVQLSDDAATDLITQNLVFATCGLYSVLGQNKNENKSSWECWAILEHHEKTCLAKVFNMLDARNGRSMFAFLTSGLDACNTSQNSKHIQHTVISYLIKKMGKIALNMESIQMQVIFNCFKLISPKLLDGSEVLSLVGEDDYSDYAFQILLPLYKVCEGYAGKVVADDVKELAKDICNIIEKIIGKDNFIQVYSQIRKSLKAKRDKRKQEEKLMAVINPMRNAKRKLRIAAKQRGHKKRKIMSMKMGRLMH